MRRHSTLVVWMVVVTSLVLGPVALAKPPGAVLAPADEVTLEILESSSDFVNHLYLWGPEIDLLVTDDDTGSLRTMSTKAGNEIKMEIRPFFGGSPIAGPWRSGPADRNPDGQVHALVTANSDGSCLLVEFEDTDAAGWDADPDEPNYVDAVMWLYPTTTPAFDTSDCPTP